jgi:hypothetical protein
MSGGIEQRALDSFLNPGVYEIAAFARAIAFTLGGRRFRRVLRRGQRS